MPNKKINELSVRTPSLNDLMIVGDPSTGYSYKATINALTAFVGNNIQFSTLGGISLTNPSNGQVLQFDGTNWVNYTPTNWNTAYDRSLVSAGVSGTTTKTLTLTKQDGSTLTATWSDLNTDAVTSVFGRTGAVVAAEGDYSLTQLSDVTLTTPSTNQVLQYNGSGWINGTISVPVTSVFGRTGNVVATEGDYTLTQLGDVTLTTPSTNQVLQYNGTAWVNATLTDNGITSLNGLTSLTQSFATGTSGTDFAISSTTSTHTFNLPTASATNRGALSSADWSTFNAKQNAITLTTTGSSGSATLVGATLNIPTYTLAGLGGVSGSGTTNYISKWTSSSALGNSLVFDDGTNVGIGTTSPSSTMELRKATGTNYLYLSNGASGTNNGVVLRYNSVDYMGMIGNFNSGEFKVGGFNASGYFMTFYSNNAERMRLTPSGRLLIGTSTESTYLLDISGTLRSTADAYFATSSGNVGIGTTSPTNLLHVKKDQNAATIFTVENVTNGANAEVQITMPSNTGTFNLGRYSTSKTAYKFVIGGSSYLYATSGDINILADGASNKLQFGAGGSSTSQMTLTAAGRLLIGTTTESTYLLDVNGTARVSGALTMTGGGTLSAALTVGGGGYFIGNSSNGFRFNNNTDASTLFYVDNGGTCVVGGQSFNTSAIFQVNSTTKGFLPPRLTTTQKTAITTPATGLVVFDTTLAKLCVYTGSAWETVVSA